MDEELRKALESKGGVAPGAAKEDEKPVEEETKISDDID